MGESESVNVGPSPQFVGLCERLRNLRSCFLPVTFDPTGAYPPEQVTKTHAYRVLSHAELEDFVEERGRDIALAAVREWKRERRASRTLVCLLAFSGRAHDAPPTSLAAPQPNQSVIWEDLLEIDRRIDAAFKAYVTRLNMNHGVKEENLLGLLLPIGIARLDLDPQLLHELNSFGSARGESAHRGAHVTAVPDPLTEYKRLQQIVQLLIPLDACLTRLARPVPIPVT